MECYECGDSVINKSSRVINSNRVCEECYQRLDLKPVEQAYTGPLACKAGHTHALRCEHCNVLLYSPAEKCFHRMFIRDVKDYIKAIDENNTAVKLYLKVHLKMLIYKWEVINKGGDHGL